MLKLTKFLKPFIISLLIAIALLFVQAMTDLALPDYMSDIVNKGIQQGGIDSSIPQIVTETDINRLNLFYNEDTKQLILSKYDLITSSDEQYNNYLEKYPKLNQQPIYVVKKLSKDEVNELSLPMAKAMLAVAGVEQMKASAKDGFIEFNGTKIPANTDLFALLANMPKAQREVLLNKSSERFTQMGDKMVVQAGANVVKSYYEGLGVDVSKLQRNYILRIGALMLLISLIGAACSIAVGFIAAKIAAGLGRNLRKRIFEKVSSFSNIGIDKFSTASLITRSTNDVTQIQSLMVMVIRMVFYAPILGIGGVLRAISKSTSMSWIIALAVIILLGLIGIIFVIALPKFKLVQKLIDKLNRVTRENLTGTMVIRAFNTQKFEENRFDKANKDLTNVNLFVNRVMVLMFPAMTFIMNATMLLIIWVGAHQIAESTMLVGDMMAYMQYAMQIIFAFLMLSMMFIMIPRAAVSAQRIAEVLETEPSIVDPKQPKKLGKNSNGVLEFKNVTFKYPGAEQAMLKNISFKAEPGKVTAIIGATGSGKTTLVNLIPRFYDVDSGEILIDDINIKDVTQHDVREVVGYVPQKATLFSGTIESNLKYGDENASDKFVKESAEIAQATEFIKDKPEAFNSAISQGGSNVSGGQKQRLSIARALVKDSKIYIFDDSFSALDFKTDAALRKALNEKTNSKTIIIVAQRISTIKKADQIIVLEDGNMVGIGTHDQLMQNCEEYREIAYSQLSKEELA
ncbi:ABC transporter ATP-binding protein [Clostridium sp. 'deep sea']|uniref:ABC transporter ATP-binding protein n=1 Tax=Clostridium sp. 'deep sea' TaxID=2779445 RepID=UPI00189643E0|nr:ABC transporter ATP-binding protein [Clostridium sp. 'deep sea']QOR34919.1 ABC transporter ATP-binding protein [Clostridium sp. 'deep sea']